jgi:ureidoglycolate lyase
MTEIVLKAAPLTASAFAPFGDVIETGSRAARLINDGTCERYDDLALVDVSVHAGRPLINLFKAEPRKLPFAVRSLERHPLSSQAFYPLDGTPFLVVVAEPGEGLWERRIRAFRAAGDQGVSYRRNTWHHGLLAVGRTSRFLVIDRGGPGENCEEVSIDPAVVVDL